MGLNPAEALFENRASETQCGAQKTSVGKDQTDNFETAITGLILSSAASSSSLPSASFASSAASASSSSGMCWRCIRSCRRHPGHCWLNLPAFKTGFQKAITNAQHD